MSPLSANGPGVAGPGAAHRRCLQELARDEPDYQAAQVYATLSLNETLREIADQLAQLTKELVIASRRR